MVRFVGCYLYMSDADTSFCVDPESCNHLLALMFPLNLICNALPSAAVVIFCAVGGRASVAKRCLEEMGYKNVSILRRQRWEMR